VARRKSTGKRLRFEVFKRDHFTCPYCGAQPPDIVLVVDHIMPVVDGGKTAIDNLLSACEACNQGKADRALTTRQIRPDADLLYLETQQEIAELRRFAVAKAERDAELARVVLLLQDDWAKLSGLDWTPSETCLRQLLGKHSAEVVERAIADVAAKVGSDYLPTRGNRWIGYLFRVAQTIATQTEYDIEA
jgi:hypothetical protein